MSLVDSILSSMFGTASLSSSATSTSSIYGKSVTAGKYLQNQRRIVKQLVETPFQQGWQFRIEIDGAPRDFDLFVKDITYGVFTIEYEDKQIGSKTISSPINKASGVVSMTVRDHDDGRVRLFMSKLAAKVVNPDGTVNLSSDYLIKLRLYRLLADDREILEADWKVSAAECGEINRSRADVNQFVSFPITFQKYMT